MSDIGIITLLLIALTFVISYRGFKDKSFYSKYTFEIDKILIYKDYKRLLTSGFLHISWMHLIFNMLSLYIFSSNVEAYLGSFKFLVIYFSGLIGGNLLSLFIHRYHDDYSSVGASGAVCAVIFASIALFPSMQIGFFLLPISFPAWVFGLGYVLFSIYAIRSRKDNVGHDAHLGGTIIGMVVALLMHPSSIRENYRPILLIITPAAVFLYIIITRPHLLFVDNNFFKRHYRNVTIDQKYNMAKHETQQEIDRILDKINTKGMASLTAKERKALEKFAEKK